MKKKQETVELLFFLLVVPPLTLNFSLFTLSLATFQQQKKTLTMSTLVPAIQRMYTHTWECIFAFLSITELCKSAHVCRQWTSAMYSMRPINAFMPIRKKNEKH